MTEDNEYDKEYIKQVFAARPEIEQEMNKIIKSLKKSQGKGGDAPQAPERKNSLNIEDVKKLMDTLFAIFSDGKEKVFSFNQLPENQQALLFQEIERISEEIFGGQENPFGKKDSLLSIIVDELSEQYIANLNGAEIDKNDLLSEQDKQRIREELRRISEYEIYKSLRNKAEKGKVRDHLDKLIKNTAMETEIEEVETEMENDQGIVAKNILSQFSKKSDNSKGVDK